MGYNAFKQSGLTLFIVEVHGHVKENTAEFLEDMELERLTIGQKQFSFHGKPEQMETIENAVEKLRNPKQTITGIMKFKY